MRQLLLVDIKDSSKVKPTKMWAILNGLSIRINTKFKLAVPMVITLGDEFQMVCQNKAQAFEVLEYIQKYLKSIEFRAVLTSYDKKTDHIKSLPLFEQTMRKTNSNPLISPQFIKAHRLLSEKLDGLVLL